MVGQEPKTHYAKAWLEEQDVLARDVRETKTYQVAKGALDEAKEANRISKATAAARSKDRAIALTAVAIAILAAWDKLKSFAEYLSNR